MTWPVVSLSSALESAEVFVDGDWVESKDQDPNGDARLIQLADVGDGEYFDKSERFLTTGKARKLKCTFLKKGDVLIARMPDPLGRACIFPGDPKPSVTVVDVCIVRPNGRGPDARWLMHCLNSPTCRNQIAGFATGTTRSRISRTNLAKIKIPFPPLPEQRRIAEVLDLVEALRAKRRVALAQLDALTQSIFLDLFGDPATNPKGWRSDKLAAFCDLMNGFAFRSSDYVELSGTLNCRMSNIRPNGEFDIDYNPKYLPDHFAQEYKNYALRDGDVIIAMTDMATEPKILGVPTVVMTKGKTLLLNQRVGKLVIEDPDSLLFSYLKQLLTQPYVKKYYKRFAGGGVQINLGKGDLLSVNVVVPPSSLQREFARRVQAVEKLKTAQRASLAELDALFASLQTRAFKGEL